MADLGKLLTTAKGMLTPYNAWIGELRNAATLRADLLAGITVALVLIPQSMAYAQLAGLPPYIGLYASFIPVMIAALMGSSRQLATGPVAVVSLMTAAALEPLAGGSVSLYLTLAATLAIMVGLFQVLLGIFRLGVLVDFLSHPVVVGFTNGAAIIIATSQLDKLFGVSVERSEHHYETVWQILVAAVQETHFSTLYMGIAALLIMVVMKRYMPRYPRVLTAVVLTTLVSWMTGFSQQMSVPITQVIDREVQSVFFEHQQLRKELITLEGQRGELKTTLMRFENDYGTNDDRSLHALHQYDQIISKINEKEEEVRSDFSELQGLRFLGSESNDNIQLFLAHQLPENILVDKDHVWKLSNIGNDQRLTFTSGGRVVGVVPSGLPIPGLPLIDFDLIMQLLAAVITISLIGFMEAIAIAKSMAAQTRQRLDTNQELFGQGLSNIAAGIFGSYPVSGSFSRSAVNISSGARTGFSSIVTGSVVAITLLFLTPLLYHLPQSTLAAVIIMAVVNLVKIKPIRHAMKVQVHDGVVAIVTFVLTLVVAPHLENAIIIGVMLSLGLYLYRTMHPRFAELSLHADGTYRDAVRHKLECSPYISILRFDGSLYFANAGYFENQVLENVASKPDLRYVILDLEGINQVDATGEGVIRTLQDRLKTGGVDMLLSRAKGQTMRIFEKSGLQDAIGSEHFFRTRTDAIDYAIAQVGGEALNGTPIDPEHSVRRTRAKKK